MKFFYATPLFTLLLVALSASAQSDVNQSNSTESSPIQSKTDFTLNDGQVRFHVPPDWTAIMEKAEGNPQAVIFQVPDAATKDSEDTANVTVKTRTLKNAAEFPTAAQEELERAKGQPGYEKDSSNKENSVHQYFIQRGKTRYLIRDSFLLTGLVSVQLRCQRPLIDNTPKSWNEQFDTACDQVAASLKKP